MPWPFRVSSVRTMRIRSAARSRLLVVAGALLTTIGLTAGSALPAAACPRPVKTYVALGDSYAAGQATDCTHTRSSYPRRLDALRSVRLVRDVACAGATTADVATSQVAALNRGVRLVTVTVGANDLDVAGLAAICTTTPASCDAAIAARQALLPALGVSLAQLYGEIAAKAPRAKILVTGYPALFATGPLVAAEGALNLTISSAVAAAAAGGAHVQYVDVQFTGHTVDSAHPWFYLSGPNVFHPTPPGDRAFACALAAAL